MAMELNVITKDELDAAAQRIIEAVSLLIKEHFHSTELYNNAKACQYLNVCPKTLQNYRDNGLLRYTQVKRKIYYSQSDLDAFLDTYKKVTFLEQIKSKKHG